MSLDQLAAQIAERRWYWELTPYTVREVIGFGPSVLDWEATVTTTKGDVQYRHATPAGALAGAYERAKALPR